MAKPGGKWQFLKSKFKKMPVEATYQQLLDKVLEAPIGEVWDREKCGELKGDPSWPIKLSSDWELNQLYLAARGEADKIGERLKALNLEIEAYTRAFVERFEEAGESSKTFENGSSIGVHVEPYAYVANQAEFLDWVKSTGQEALLTVQYQTMASIVKGKLEANQPAPPGIDVFYKDKLSCRNRPKN